MSDTEHQSQEEGAEPNQPPVEAGVVIGPDQNTPNEASVNHEIITDPQPSDNQPKKRFKFLSKIKPEYIFPKFLRSKFGRHARPAAIAVIVLVIGGIGAAAYYKFSTTSSMPQPVFAAQIAPFRVVSTIPADNAQNVDEQSSITVKFNRPVDAQKLQDDFFVTPRTDGTVKQGTNQNEIVFTPKVPFGQGTAVQVMIHGDFLSKNGDKLGADYNFGFSTVIPDDGVVFSQDGIYTKLSSSVANADLKFTLQVGSSVKPGGKVTLYKANVNKLLESFVYDNKEFPDGSGTYKDFIHQAIGTSDLEEVKSLGDLKDGATVDINEDVGVYLAVATSGNKQAGWTWVIFNKNGLLLNQDDKKIVLGTQSLTNGSTNENASVSLYNLDKSVQTIDQDNVSGIKELSTVDASKVDFVVGKFGSEVAVVPVNELDSLADLRLATSLVTTNKFYGLTDRPTYQVKDTVRFAGYIRADNDALYKPASANSIKFYVTNGIDEAHLANITTTVDAGGKFSGSFAVGSNFLATDQDNQQLYLYAIDSSNNDNPVLVTTFTVTGSVLPQYNFKVSFNKASYLANESVVAQVTAIDATTGKPLANTTATYNIYSKTYYENDPASNLSSDSDIGSQIGTQNATLHLDSNGKASVKVNLSDLPAGDSQVVTVQVSKADAKKHTGSAGASTIVHQGNAIITFGPAKADFQPNEPLIGRVYLTDLTGQPLANKKAQYKFVNYSGPDDGSGNATQNILASGTVTADSNGLAAISQNLSTSAGDVVYLIVDVQDNNNLTVEAQTYLYIVDSSQAVVHSDAELSDLDISGSNGHAKVGDDLKLNIKSPRDMTVMVSYLRGRIYKSDWLTLKQGDNSYDVNIDAALSPSFTLSFSYFYNGQYYQEGTSFDVDSPVNKGSTTLTPDKTSYATGDTVNIDVSTKDGNGSPLGTHVIVGVVSDSIFSLNNNVASDIFTSFYGPRQEITTNSSSSLTGIGTGGGGCGGGGPDSNGFANLPGQLLYWNPSFEVAGNGSNNIKFTAKKGTWRVYAYSVSDNTIVSSGQTTVTVQ